MGDLFVLPSAYGETWGLAVNEAMACGRPALVSDCVGCHPDVVRRGVNGDVFAADDWGNFHDKLAPMSLRISWAPRCTEIQSWAKKWSIEKTAASSRRRPAKDDHKTLNVQWSLIAAGGVGLLLVARGWSFTGLGLADWIFLSCLAVLCILPGIHW